MAEKRYEKASLALLPAVDCPCGTTRRAFVESGTASVHLLQVDREARRHYHKGFTEIYTVLSGEGYLELDGERVPVQPLDSVMIPPGIRHRAVGELTVLNVAVPAFDADDEWFD